MGSSNSNTVVKYNPDMFTSTPIHGMRKYLFKDRSYGKLETSIEPENCTILLKRHISYDSVLVKNIDRSKPFIMAASAPSFCIKIHKITFENGQIQYNPPLKDECNCYYRHKHNFYKKCTTRTILFEFSSDNNEGAKINQVARKLVETIQKNIYDDFVVSKPTKFKVSPNQVDDILHLLNTQGNVNVTLIPIIFESPSSYKTVYVNYNVYLKNDQKNDQKNDEHVPVPVEIIEVQEIVEATNVFICK